METETVAVVPRLKTNCPILSIAKVTVFALVAVFVLYLPLGDPRYYCTNVSPHNTNVTMACLCDFYYLSEKMICKSMKIAERMFLIMMDMLHEVKLKFYAILERVDGDDLCRVVCCSDSKNSIDGKREGRRPNCRCTKKCIKKKSDS